MKRDKQPGLIPVSALHGRPSASADAARLQQILADLELTPRQRLEKAIRLGRLKVRGT
jgi:hypothetical protein